MCSNCSDECLCEIETEKSLPVYQRPYCCQVGKGGPELRSESKLNFDQETSFFFNYRDEELYLGDHVFPERLSAPTSSEDLLLFFCYFSAFYHIFDPLFNFLMVAEGDFNLCFATILF